MPFPKPRPAAFDKLDRKAKREALDERESKRVKLRSGGRCEAVIDTLRCNRRASQMHHMIGGWGKRARGPSVLAEHKQHVCTLCHHQITNHLITRIGSAVKRWTDGYMRGW